MNTKTMTGIFKDLNANRRERAESRKEAAVYRVMKNGELAKRPSAMCDTINEAMAQANLMERLNPGHEFKARYLARIEN